ncbi:hypothetical protein DFJ63DRAFT_312990 [Scheffersomyces coipomensis]|uniref:uncharacterized protein n=1 Tax=Scheffersomyces coipomensis TaxID=1788519 RepID=UPI00315CF116
MVFQFIINDSLLRRSIQLVQNNLQNANHDYLQVETLPSFRENRQLYEVDFGSVEDSRNEDFKGLRKEIALRLRCFHHYVGNRDILQANGNHYEVILEPPFTPSFLLEDFISEFSRELISESGIVDGINDIIKNVKSVFDYSQLFVLPFPPPIYQVGGDHDSRPTKKQRTTNQLNTNDPVRSNSFTLTRGAFESFRQIQAVVIDENNQDIQGDVIDENNQDIQPVGIHFVAQIGSIQTGIMPHMIRNESDVTRLVKTAILNPVRKLLSQDYSGLALRPQRYGMKLSIPDYSFKVKIGESIFLIPVELKSSGVYNSFKRKDTRFSDLMNQSIYQMLTCKSSISFVFDKDCIMVIKLVHEIPEFAVEELTQIRLAKIKCNIQCVKYKDSSPAVIFYKSMFSYLSGATVAAEAQVESIFEAMRLTDDDKTAVTQAKYVFMRNEWLSQFSRYKLTRGYYIRYHERKQTDIRILEGVFKKSLLNFDTTINREDFEDITPIQGGRDNTRYNSNVFRLKYNKAPNENRRMILKVYDPVSATIKPSHTHSWSFQRAFAFSLLLFLNELRCYKKLREVNSRGSQVDRPSSLIGASEALNYTPYLYSSGFIDWPSEIIAGNKQPTRFSGFFLLMEEISRDFPETEEEYQRAAAQALQSIHAIGLLHGDVIARNFRYDASRQRVIFFDFGSSSYTNRKPNALIAVSDKQKIYELDKLRFEVSKAFRKRPIRPVRDNNLIV